MSILVEFIMFDFDFGFDLIIVIIFYFVRMFDFVFCERHRQSQVRTGIRTVRTVPVGALGRVGSSW